jgi:peptidyl-prolyl cis-trans isomerase C
LETVLPRVARGPNGTLRRLGQRFLREPFLHFLLLGAALFTLNQYLEERSRLTGITITKAQISGIADRYRLQYGGPPSPAQLEALAGTYIKEEIFYREALKLGLDKDDEIIRRRLLQKFEFLQQDLTTPVEPTDSQRVDYYEKHLDAYRLPERLTFTHVYFSPDRRGERSAREAAEELASNRNLKGITRAVDQGDRFPGPDDFTALSREELGRVFGQEGLSEAIFGVELNRWSAPLRSGFGWHTVYVSARQPGRQASFEEVRADVRRDYIEAERNRRNAEALAKLRERFKIVRE